MTNDDASELVPGIGVHPRPKPGRHASKEQQRRRHTSRDRQGACTVAVCEHRTAHLPISSGCMANSRCQFRPRPHRRAPTAAPSYRAAWEASWGEFTIVGISSSPPATPIKAATTPIPHPAISPATTRTTAPSSGEPSSPKWPTTRSGVSHGATGVSQRNPDPQGARLMSFRPTVYEAGFIVR